MTCPVISEAGIKLCARNIINMCFLRRLLNWAELNAYFTTGELEINVFFPLIFCQLQLVTVHPFGLSTVLSYDAAD